MHGVQQPFFADGLMPHGHSYLWDKGLISVHVASDALIAFSYYSIALTLVYFLRQRKDIGFNWTLACLAGFIIACGTAHLMEIWTVWHPTDWLSGGIKALAALASVPTAILLIKLIPKALAFPSSASLQEANLKLQREMDGRKQGEIALRRSELMFQRFFDSTPDAVILIDRAGLIVRANARAEILFATPGEKLATRSIETLLPDRFRAELGEHLAACFAAPHALTANRGFELFARRKEGAEFPVDIMLSLLETDDGPKAIAVVRDITERKLDRDQFFELSRDLFSISDLDGRYKRLNPAWEKTLGYSRGELIGQGDQDLIHVDDLKTAVRVHEQVLGGAEAQSFELRLRSKDGSYRWILGNSVSDHEQRRIYFTGRDISRRKANEQEIQELNAALQHRAKELELINREIESFSYSLSHDLRAPLRHIGSFTELLANNPVYFFDAAGRRHLDFISAAVKQMDQLIDDVISFSRTGRATIDLRSVDSERLLAEVVRAGHYTDGGRAIAWEIGPLSTVQADAAMLRQVWANLIENAVKYSSKNPHPHITITSTTDTAAHEHVFSVRDNGVGFDMAFAGNLFSPFQRLHRSSEFEGTGIGLANVRRIVGRHGGRTWAEGKVGEGAVIYFSLPFAPPPSRATAPIPPLTGVLPIFFVDENANQPATLHLLQAD